MYFLSHQQLKATALQFDCQLVCRVVQTFSRSHHPAEYIFILVLLSFIVLQIDASTWLSHVQESLLLENVCP